MSEMAPEYRLAACRWNGRGQARTVPGRHDGQCTDDTCPGCAECPSTHCRVCDVVHTPGTCPECLAETREALHQIAKMCGALPEEVEHRGIDGEAMYLIGPVADPEAWGHMEASVLSGRVPEEYLSDAVGELHPLWVLGTADMLWRDALDHDDRTTLTLEGAVDYLDANLTYMGGYEHIDFAAFATQLRRCRNHLEAVLHDGEQRETGAPCMTCHKPLERTWGDDEKQDGWKCHRCHQTSTDAQYRFAVMHLHREEAEWLTDRDMQIRTGVKAGTVRSWARAETALVRKKRDQDRTVYAVADVMTVAKDKGLVA